MASRKKRGTKKKSSRRTVTKIIHESTKEIRIEKAIIENFVSLQKVMVNLSSKFDSLTGEMKNLIELFGSAAKTLAKRDFEYQKENKEAQEILQRLEGISQQAGLIGRGLALIHETNYPGLDKTSGYERMPENIPSSVQKKAEKKPAVPQSEEKEEIMPNKTTHKVHGYAKSSLPDVPEQKEPEEQGPPKKTLFEKKGFIKSIDQPKESPFPKLEDGEPQYHV